MRTTSPMPPPSPDDLLILIVPLRWNVDGSELASYALGDAHPTALAAAQRAPLLLGQPTPDTRVLGRVQCPLEALLTDGAEGADGLGRLHLGLGRSGGADREEQFGVDIAAAG